MAKLRMPMTAGTTVTVPQLSGGINQYDTPMRLADSQLTDSDNMWWHKGALRTRPGLHTELGDEKHYPIHQSVNERESLLSRFRISDTGATMNFYAALFSAGTGLTRLGAKCHEYKTIPPPEGVAVTSLGLRAEKGAETGWYYLLSNGDVIQENPNREDETAGKAWVKAEPYIPTVMINGKGDELEADTAPTAYEDYNMLTRAFSCTFTTDGKSHNWQLPLTDLGNDGAKDNPVMAKVELTVANGEAIRTIEVVMDKGVKSVALELAEAGLDANDYSSCSLQIKFVSRTGKLTTQLYAVTNGSGATNAAIPEALPFVSNNNLKVTAWRNASFDKEREVICRMSRVVWFGGDRSGTEGGTRCFVTGNPDDPSLIHWSGIEHPLYFPEHNYVRVGEERQAVTAFGKQGDLLVVFKEREMYALQYVAGGESDTDYAVAGGVALTTYMAKFPVTPLNPSVGCDCPDTVRLVNNRLVWMNSDGQVYMLTATNQYSERNVRMISRNIRQAMTALSAATLKNAQAAEYEGYYLVMAGKKIFLLDVQTSAFHSFNYYSDEDSARKALPWFVWSLPMGSAYTSIVSDGSALRITATTEDGQVNERVCVLEGETDDGEPIPCRFSTKWWDFGRPDRRKSVEEIYTNVGCQPGGRVWLTYITEEGESTDPYPIRDGRSDKDRDRRCLRRVRVTPNVRMVQCFGVRFSCDRAMEVDGIHIKVRQQGVVR